VDSNSASSSHAPDATSIPALAVKTAFFTGDAGSPAAAAGAILELLLAAACVGTALMLFPVTRRVSEPLGLGFVVSRTLEAAMIMVGLVPRIIPLIGLIGAPLLLASSVGCSSARGRRPRRSQRSLRFRSPCGNSQSAFGSR
jgi:hypothetical protein